MPATPEFTEPRKTRPPLPEARGELSAHLLSALRAGREAPLSGPVVARADGFGEDLQLALYVLYELHYQGFDGLPDSLEWDPPLLQMRRILERRFLEALREETHGAEDVAAAMADLLVEPSGYDPTNVTHYLQKEGSAWQLREYAAMRSLYHLKEADPHAWVLPRIYGRAKAGMVAVLYDEFGAGRAEQVHARLFADLMANLGLRTDYGHYVDGAPGEMLAIVNLMSLFGLHRALRGALVGHFAVVEVTSPPGSRRLAKALRRTGAGEPAAHFYDEHVEADAVHEQVVRRDVIDGLLADEPALEPDVVLGIEATDLLEDRFGAYLLQRWRDNRTALRTTFTLSPTMPAAARQR
ncbi:hypothetical protein DSC45_13445 [Streptomyces sp. YIM 130001]|uniref:iron-containing redox enzyme family protein n=1 Tax=Streptomyces sp. YIM 130001 TaxID=2259644 RepID=UPI000E65E2DD|nr:iron-containing redox enzyme family protein [Streptomyces sp. YIM 130001]RII17903.1 hypothetical protein DSC45_13445 [Streptomyces sp. YIM 130001]